MLSESLLTVSFEAQSKTVSKKINGNLQMKYAYINVAVSFRTHKEQKQNNIQTFEYTKMFDIP